MRLSDRLATVVAVTAAVLISCTDAIGPTTPENSAGSALRADRRDNPATQSATGSGHYYTRSGLWRTFGFSGTRKPNGTVSGRFHFRIHDAQGQGSRIWGDVTCLNIEGNQAWLAGYVTKAGNANHVGRAHGFRVVDNGEGKDAAPDQITVTWPGTADIPYDEPQEYCDGKPNQLLHALQAGNVQVRP